MIRLSALRFAYGDRHVLQDVDLEVAPGELVVVAGPNGADKSTLLKLALGLLTPDSGRAELDGVPVTSMSRREIARRAAFVPQSFDTEFELTVRDLVAMGRTPHQGRLSPESDADRAAIQRALADAEIEPLADRPFPQLSGGEKKRVLLARAFAQDCNALILDEPNASLDLLHAFTLSSLVRARADAGAAVLAALHDLSLAARFADRIAFLHDGALYADGPPADVLTPKTMADVFGVEARVDDGHVVVTGTRTRPPPH